MTEEIYETTNQIEHEAPNSGLSTRISTKKRKTLDFTQSDATIEVCNPVTKEEKFAKHTLYTIRGIDKEGSYESLRRYSDFPKIRAVLVARWPAVYIPPLPPKKAINNMEAKFIEERRRSLDQFCKRVSAISFLHYSEEFQLFIRSKTTDLEKALQSFQKIDYGDLLTKYTSSFSYLIGREPTSEASAKINSIKLFLMKVKGLFENFKKFSKSVATAKKSYYEQLSNFHHMTCVPYEKNVFSEYHGHNDQKNVFFAPANPEFNEVAEKLKEPSNRQSFESINEWIEAESREIEVLIFLVLIPLVKAFMEAIEQRDKYEKLKAKIQEKQKSETNDLQKIVAGKKTMKTIFSNKPKEESISNLEQTIANAAKNLEELSALYDIMTIILAYDEIDKFKKKRIDEYYQVLRLSAENELQNLNCFSEYWKSVLGNENVKLLDLDFDQTTL